MRSCLSEASSSNDYDNITADLRAQDVFENLFEMIRQKGNEEKTLLLKEESLLKPIAEDACQVAGKRYPGDLLHIPA